MALDVVQATQISMTWGIAWPSDTNLAVDGGPGPNPRYPCNNMCHGHQHRPWLQQDHLPRYDPRQLPGPSVSMAAGSRTDNSVQYGSAVGMALRHQHGHMQQPRPQAYRWPLMGTWATDVSTDLDWDRSTDSSIVLGRSPGIDVTMVPCSKQATLISLFLTSFASSLLPLSKVHKLFCSFSPISPPCIYSSQYCLCVQCHMAPCRTVDVYSQPGL